MKLLVKDEVGAVWAILMTATVVAWFVGSNHSVAADRGLTIGLFVIAYFKVRLVGLYFMELRRAPLALRLLFETWAAVTFGMLLGFSLAGA